MKRLWIGLVILTLVVSVSAVNEVKVKVMGDRVSLRAAPEINSLLLERAMFGDLLVLKDNSKKEWLGVAPPYSMDVWVKRDYIQDDKVMPGRLNIRSGPSLNHGVVGVVKRGDTLTVRGEADSWLRIAPPATTVVWVSRKYSKILGAVNEQVVVINVEPAPEPEAVEVSEPVVIIEVVEDAPKEAVVVLTVVQPEINQMMVAAAEVSQLPGTLVPDPKKDQGMEESFSGMLMPAEGLLSKLVDVGVGEITVCYVRGNASQMRTLEGAALTITGKAYWALDLDMPFIRPVKIQVLPK